MPAQTENDKAWQRYLDAQAIRFDQPFYAVNAVQLKELGGREPRLMAKFDTPEQLAAPLRNAGYTLLPVKNGEYVLIAGNAFALVPPCESIGVFNPLLPFPLYTAGRGSSEAQYIDQAYNIGLLHHFLGMDAADGLFQTIRGREYTSRFEFRFSGRSITVESVQIEVDAGYEGLQDIVLLEAKIGLPKHLNIRQVYYPFRHFSQLVPQKRVRNIFLAYDIPSTQYSLYEYIFPDVLDPTSAQVRQCANYRLQAPRRLNIHSLIDVRFQTTGTTAPQADDLNKIFELVTLVGSGVNRAPEVADYFVFDQRQSSYYREAAEYLGLIRHSRHEGYSLTESGMLLLTEPSQEKPLVLAKLIINSWIFVELIRRASKSRLFTFEDIDAVIGSLIHGGVPRYSGTTISRRGKTIKAWIAWLAQEIGCFAVEGDRVYLR
ncbi:MAG: hypothetical protein L6Q98_23915 [Anaerolineae bacterium]|nr:hypothetical protein [Anaerolineae bacterium]NUQ06524.1 hypothetical protein [Anaerolineae bacterium]